VTSPSCEERWDRVGIDDAKPRKSGSKTLSGSQLPHSRPKPGINGPPVGMKSLCAVNLHNAVTVSQQRLGRRVAQLSSARMNEVCAALRFSLGCDSN
jgi:hypothetical protein